MGAVGREWGILGVGYIEPYKFVKQKSEQKESRMNYENKGAHKVCTSVQQRSKQSQ